jgi:uncharacterized membrane protein YfcA
MIELAAWTWVAVTCVAFIAGLFSAIAGAGGMITLPLLLSAGIPPILALGTNKVQSAVGTLSSTINFLRGGHIDLDQLKSALGWSLLGAVIGVLLVRSLGNELLQTMLPIMLVVTALYFLASPRLSDSDSQQRISDAKFNRWVGGGMGLYGGFFGPGMATFLALAFISLLGYNARRATAHTKPLVLVINGSSAVIFALAGDVFWSLAITMAAAQFIGARIGSNLVMSQGAAIVRPALIIGSLLLALKVLLFP